MALLILIVYDTMSSIFIDKLSDYTYHKIIGELFNINLNRQHCGKIDILISKKMEKFSPPEKIYSFYESEDAGMPYRPTWADKEDSSRIAYSLDTTFG